MNRKITRFALAGWGAGLACSGRAALATSASKASRANAPNPQAALRRNLRRDKRAVHQEQGLGGHVRNRARTRELSRLREVEEVEYLGGPALARGPHRRQVYRPLTILSLAEGLEREADRVDVLWVQVAHV